MHQPARKGDLVEGPASNDMKVAAILGADGVASAPKRNTLIVPPRPAAGLIGMTISASTGDYRAGDEVWLEPLDAADYARALNRDVLVPRPAGRFLFGRMIDRDGTKALILPFGAGARQQVVADPAWLAVAVKLVRAL